MMIKLSMRSLQNYFAQTLLQSALSPISIASTKSRNVSTSHQSIIPHTLKLFPPSDVASYKALYPTIIKTIVKEAHEIPEVGLRFQNLMDRMLPNDMLIEGLKVVALYKTIDPPEKQTPEKVFLSNILGWCADLMLCGVQVVDDVLDNADTRWGKPCFHQYEDVKNQVGNDYIVIENAPYVLLREFCSELPWYRSCVDLMRDSTLKTAFGQTLEELSRVNGKPEFEKFTKSRVKLIAKYKAVLAVVIPLKLAMYSSGKDDPSFYYKVEDVLTELRIFLTAQDDVVDYYDSRADFSISNDISEGKCNWLVVEVLQKVSEANKQLLYKHYGKRDIRSVEIIDRIYQQVDVYSLYQNYKSASYDYVTTKTQCSSLRDIHKELLLKFIDTIYEMSSISTESCYCFKNE